MFKWSNETYDSVKFIALHVIPALEMLWGTVASVWNLPYGTQIGATIGAVGLFIAMCIGQSKKEYEKDKHDVVEGEIDG